VPVFPINESELAGAAVMHRAAHDRLVDIDVTVADLQIEAALRVSAYPGFVMNCGALTAKIGQGNQVTLFAFLTLGEISLFQLNATSQPDVKSLVVYNKPTRVFKCKPPTGKAATPRLFEITTRSYPMPDCPAKEIMVFVENTGYSGAE